MEKYHKMKKILGKEKIFTDDNINKRDLLDGILDLKNNSDQKCGCHRY